MNCPYWCLVLFALFATLSHPTLVAGKVLPSLGFLAFLSYLPLISILKNESFKNVFKKTLFFSVFFNLTSMYWLYTALNSFGGLAPWISVCVQILLALILALYFTLPWLASKWIHQKLKLDFYWTLPVFFVAMEWCRSYWPLGGFPWGQMGYSQARYLTLIQIADLLGVYGVTALVLWGNLWLGELFGAKEKVKIKLLFFPLLFLMIFFYGKYQIK